MFNSKRSFDHHGHRMPGARHLLVCLVALCLALPIQAGLPANETLNYQGRLLDNGAPFTGSVDMNFEIWTQQTGGTMVSSQSVTGVAVANGLFQVELLFGTVPWGDGLWLEVEADGITLTPRQRVAAAPLALHALNGGGFWELDGGILSYDDTVAINSNATEALIVDGGVVGISATADGNAVFGQTANGIAVQGVATGTAAQNYGLYGTSFSDAGFGVYATNIDPLGTAMRAEGFVGLNAEADSTGVFARGDDNGVYGESPNVGLFGAASNANGYGGYFAGVPGSKSYFAHPVGIDVLTPGAMLEINGPGVNGNGRALRISVNDDEKLIVGALGTSIYDPVFLDGTLTITTFATGGGIDVCRTGTTGTAGQLAACSSSGRYKTNIESIDSATALIDRLRPVTFEWIETGEEDLGLVAEEVAAIEPRLAIYNADGQVEGVKYRQLGALLIRALQEQRQETEQLHGEVRLLTQQLEQSEGLLRQNQELAQRLERLEAALLGEQVLVSRD
ncbi:tail fiber domain-containing protein [Wenzhouxiangella marina]|uniref:Uncharacterized protein n=1 Tax=Wenzhouxiangella marina TaxID=1579979 RepID=A0A0K0XZC6_9GAMM|nr:tail fiber domain-containing protein [Wenzhouxiangella marina]AKS43025.1 hypothetical protein WM2015_2667 [Wenzhouxiangella marina]MBB6087292.1 hypothetical protein [Wenzhouxiangella marina]